ncbi:MAG: hypothetical protein ACLPVF_00425 [Acidimicrobiales bacterium]
MSLITLDPTSGSFESAGTIALAPRPASLQGQTLGIIANGLGRSEVMFDVLAEQLAKWDDLAGAVKVVKPSVSVPPWPEQWVDITEHATVAVTGFGGCGSCSTRSVRDALDLEAAGIPAVCLVHVALVPAVQAMCRLVGCPDYPFVVVDYPYNPTGVWSVEECNAMAAEVIDGVRVRLTA